MWNFPSRATTAAMMPEQSLPAKLSASDYWREEKKLEGQFRRVKQFLSCMTCANRAERGTGFEKVRRICLPPPRSSCHSARQDVDFGHGLIYRRLFVGAVDGIAGAVEDMGDFRVMPAGDPNGDKMMYIDAWPGRRLHRIEAFRVGAIEHPVDAQPPGLMARDAVRDFVGGEAVHPVMLPVALRRCVIRQLGLIKIHPPTVAVPQRLIFLEMFDEEAIEGDLGAVDDQAAFAFCFRSNSRLLRDRPAKAKDCLR